MLTGAMLALPMLVLAAPAWAQPLRWAADSQSGAPYVFHDPQQPQHLTGYETDIIEGVAARLHRRPDFVQNDWDGLIPGLNRGLYDVVIDGLEITPEHRAAVDFSIPYYTTYEQWAVRRGGRAPASLAEVGARPVGTLKASAAERMLQAAGARRVIAYDEENNAYADLADGRVDAVLLDAPIALYYAAPDPRLVLDGAPVGRLEYGIAIAPGHDGLRLAINDALRAMQADGSLRAILQDWNLGSPMPQAGMRGLAGTPGVASPPHKAYGRFLAGTAPRRGVAARLRRYAGFLPLIGRGAVMTVAVSLGAMAIAIGAGLGLALLRLHAPRPLNWLAIGFIEIMRGTPLLIQILFVFYALPGLGVTLPPFAAGVIALGLNYAAYEAENDRAALQAVPHGQSEAASALNLNRWQALRHVIVPQALRIAVPLMTNDFISLLKDSSLVSVITLTELTQTYVRLSTTYYDYLGTGLLVGGAYLVLGLPFVQLSRVAERRLGGGRGGR